MTEKPAARALHPVLVHGRLLRNGDALPADMDPVRLSRLIDQGRAAADRALPGGPPAPSLDDTDAD